ncbi:MAG TPA: CHRD domain-containing protein [Woeseiaceae bacterium]|nr:CHRD domain-containing protein [Woeseiaceae bacterium]
MSRRLAVFVLGLGLMGLAAAQPPKRFHAQLFGFDLTGQPVQTNAVGNAVVEVIDGGTALSFQVEVAGITNLFMAHIHVAPAPVEVTEAAGPIAFWFTGGPPPEATVTERINGNLAGGYIITDAQVDDWNSADAGSGTVAGLIAAIEAGRASVIVHTNDLDPNTPVGRAGDSPAGEIRGTLR